MPGPCILVVDDDPAIRLLCRVNLELDGYDLVEAASLAEARAALAEHDVAAVLLDVHVGPEDGRELLRELRRDRPDVPVGLLTGSADPARVVEEVAPDAIVPKPFTLQQLHEAVGLLTSLRSV